MADGPLKIQVDVKGIAEAMGVAVKEIEPILQGEIEQLAKFTKEAAQELAQSRLKDSKMRELYLDNLDWEQVTDGIWVVWLDQPAMWLEEGIKAGDMKPWLLKNAKPVKNPGPNTGTKYKVIPFLYGQSGKTTGNLTPTSTPKNSAFTQSTIKDIRVKLQEENAMRKLQNQPQVNLKNIEYNKDGSPKSGKLHEFNFGHGRGNAYPSPTATTRTLTRLSIYQTVKDGKARRDILTFRTVSDGPGSQGKWMHPGRAPLKILDEAFKIAEDRWFQQVLPKIMEKK